VGRDRLGGKEEKGGTGKRKKCPSERGKFLDWEKKGEEKIQGKVGQVVQEGSAREGGGGNAQTAVGGGSRRRENGGVRA